MSFSLDLHAGAVKALFLQQPMEYPKPLLQILRLQKLETFQTKFNSERYKLLLSDGVHYMQAVLSPKLNTLVFTKQVSNNSVVKLIEYDLHVIKGKKLLVVLNMEEIIRTFSTVLGSPVSIENAAQTLDMESNNSSSSSSRLIREKPVNCLSTDFLHLLNNPELSDINFILKGGQRIFAHKNILVSRSSYFRSLLMNGMKESFQTEIMETEWEPEVFVAIMHFIYSDQVVLNPATTSIEFIWDLFMAAKYYGLDRLAKLCEQHLVNERITEETVCLLLNTANEMDAKYLEKACIRYLEQNFEQIAKTDYFLILPKELLLHILSSPELIVSSQDIIADAILKWAKTQMDFQGVQNISKQELLCQFFPLLRLRRKWNPTANIGDIKKSVLELLKSASLGGLRISRIVDKLKDSFSSDDIRNCVQLLQSEGQVRTEDGEHFFVSSCTDRKRINSSHCVFNSKRRRITNKG